MSAFGFAVERTRDAFGLNCKEVDSTILLKSKNKLKIITIFVYKTGLLAENDHIKIIYTYPVT